MTTPVSAPTRRWSEGLGAFAGIGFALTLPTSGPAGAEASCDGVAATRCNVELPDGLRISYVETGPSDGQAVLLIHGLTDNPRSRSTTGQSLHGTASSRRPIRTP